mmetsp:Transcript_51109/g.121428  ORF Transcript_51109/g.121428 Transcript_51109/m.121428 type:complete len:726 (-) Transcript_51109:74-2251(-)|eukprot:CAMPEP_0178436142 /NCGR_PEP_ID=MMETSP0689_2-20121128/34288_1 /TAXON_ID=160604 /ORGANISM="Amphidinium massartii, Strain CS-259" /LENGTH=725 /DNA_ID=CAMNT_0020058231 /DNA_START=47 /DNA_END=2224 /DNA_ORIENTATION=-
MDPESGYLGTVKEKPVMFRLRNFCWVSARLLCKVSIFGLMVLAGTALLASRDTIQRSPSQSLLGEDFWDSQFFGASTPAPQEKETPTEIPVVVHADGEEEEKPLPDIEEDDASLGGMTLVQAPRRRLGNWVKSTATYEEVRLVQQFQEWMADVPRNQVVSKLQAMFLGAQWITCAQEGEICQCPSGKVRYGNTEADAWLTEEKSRKGEEVAVSCGSGSFGGKDPKKGGAKICQCEVISCPDGTPADFHRCPANNRRCAAACGRVWKPRVGNGQEPRSDLCKDGVSHELVFSCDLSKARLPKRTSKHWEAQQVLNKAMEDFCAHPQLKDQLDVYLDCAYKSQYLRHTTDDSEWLDEGYLTYIGGSRNSHHERRISNLIRSVQAFSQLPVAVVVVDEQYQPPPFWREFPSLIVFQLSKFPSGLPFNINKIRAMVSVRIATGAQLDGDSTLFAGMDNMMEPTRREVTPAFPFPMLPVHWGPREEVFDLYKGPRSMRWVHAHPTWTYWALPFYIDLVFVRTAGLVSPGREIKLFRFDGTKDMDMRHMLEVAPQGKETRKAIVERWMISDEPMLNVLLWKAGVTKQWCKYDLEPALYTRGYGLNPATHADPHWFPDGVPLIFYSMHNTKNDKEIDLLISLSIFCHDPKIKAQTNCQEKDALEHCKLGKVDSLKARRQRTDEPTIYTPHMCCCIEPREETPFFFAGKWYKEGKDVPMAARPGGKERLCVLP